MRNAIYGLRACSPHVSEGFSQSLLVQVCVCVRARDKVTNIFVTVLQKFTLKGLFCPFTFLKSLKIIGRCERLVPVLPTDRGVPADADGATERKIKARSGSVCGLILLLYR